MDGAQDGAGQQQAADGQHGAETTAGQEGGGDSGFHLGKPLRAEILRDHHRAADVAAHGHRHEQHGHRIGSAHRRQGVLAHEFPRDHAVRDVVYLLEHDADEHRDGEQPQPFADTALRQIGYHTLSPPVCWSSDLSYHRKRV